MSTVAEHQRLLAWLFAIALVILAVAIWGAIVLTPAPPDPTIALSQKVDLLRSEVRSLATRFSATETKITKLWLKEVRREAILNPLRPEDIPARKSISSMINDARRRQERDIGEWDDDHPLNNPEAADEEFKRLFHGDPEMPELRQPDQDA